MGVSLHVKSQEGRLMLRTWGLVLIACLLVPVGSMEEDSDTKTFGDLSAKEHCIRNYELGWNERDIDRLAELFDEQCVFWYRMNPEAAAEGKEYLKHDVDRELASWKSMFEDAQTIELEIGDGQWRGTSEVMGTPCPECWETDREYYLTISLATLVESHGRMKVIVRAVEQKYRIVAIIYES